MLTILTPATSQRLTTLAAVKAEQKKPTSSEDDALLETLIDQASAAITAWCGRPFARETVRETFHLEIAAPFLILTRRPVLSIAALTINGVSMDPTCAEADEAGLLYRVEPDGRRIAWLPGRCAVDYVAGYTLPGETDRTLPADVERAALIAVNNLWHACGDNHFQKVSEVEGLGRMVFETDGSGVSGNLSADARALLAPHCDAVFR